MQLNKMFILSASLIFCTNIVFAKPPFQVLRTCMDEKPYNEKIKFKMLEEFGATEAPMTGCESQYNTLIDGHAYGTAICNQKFYFIINDKKMDPELADNYSINPEIKPGVPFTDSSSIWYKIDYENNTYVCVFSSLSDSGIGAAYSQYYIIENAFVDNLEKKISYYFFDKDIVPITSDTL